MNQQGLNVYLNLLPELLDCPKREEWALSLGQDRLIKQPPPEPVEFDGVEQGEEQPPPEPIEFDDVEEGEEQPPPEPVEFEE